MYSSGRVRLLQRLDQGRERLGAVGLRVQQLLDPQVQPGLLQGLEHRPSLPAGRGSGAAGGTDPEQDGALTGLDHLRHGLDDRLLLPVFAHGHKLRLVAPEHNGPLGHVRAHELRQGADASVPLGVSQRPVDLPQPQNVKDGDHRGDGALRRPVQERLPGAVVERLHVEQAGEPVHLVVGPEDLHLGVAAHVRVLILLLPDIHNEHIIVILPVPARQQMAEVLDIALLPLLCDDAVADVIVPPAAVEGLGQNGALHPF